jgi:hypothetical protein
MRWQCLAVTAFSIYPVIAALQAQPDRLPTAKPVPPHKISALQQGAQSAAEGKPPPSSRNRPANAPSRVCSIPLVEMPYRKDVTVDRMPKPRVDSADRNQIPPPAPPCSPRSKNKR